MAMVRWRGLMNIQGEVSLGCCTGKPGIREGPRIQIGIWGSLVCTEYIKSWR